MPVAVPGVGECKICFEIVPSVKVLDCGHSLCLPCASKIIDCQRKVQAQSNENGSASTTVGHLVCPECRFITECGAQGVRSLRTRYFGLLKCDLCLEKKDADDCWWCGECIRAICSKCSIKEHSKLNHSISEWNKLEPVKYSVNYVSQVKVARQGSTDSEHNRNVINQFMTSIEKTLHQELSTYPELDRLQSDLFDRYGSRFRQHQSMYSLHRSSTSSPNLLCKDKQVAATSVNDEGAKVVTKVLQLAGANIEEALVPSISDQKFQIHFTISADEIAKYIRSKIQFIPYEQEPVNCKRRIPSVPSTVTNGNGASTISQPYRHSYHNMDRIREEEAPGPSSSTPTSHISEDGPAIINEIFLTTSTPARGQIAEIDYDGHSLIAFRYSTNEICLLNLLTRKTISALPIQMKYECRSLCFSESPGLLYLALQCTAKRHEWMLEAIDISKSPICIVFTTLFDIDPEDRVESLRLSIGTGRKEQGVLYEVRSCARNVSEIWRACVDRKSKTPSKVKLKESMIYQKDESNFGQILIIPNQPANKEYTLFIWDDHSKGLYRLIIRDKRCHSSTKIATAPTCIPYSLDLSNRLWIFDPCTGYICVSSTSVLNKFPVIFKQTYRFIQDGILRRIWADVPTASLGGDFIFLLNVSRDSKSLKTLKIIKTEPTDTDAYFDGRHPASIKRRSFSARV